MNKINLNFNLGEIIKLFKRGNIVKTYEKMYLLAEQLAKTETQEYQTELLSRINVKSTKNEIFSSLDKIWNFKMERIHHHMKEMKDLLIMHFKINK